MTTLLVILLAAVLGLGYANWQKPTSPTQQSTTADSDPDRPPDPPVTGP